MIIEQYGITLKRVELEDIELIRKWRNHPDIRKSMEFKKRITADMQRQWFDSINNPYNYYFLIYYQNQPMGVLNCKNINLKDTYGEGGIFIWDSSGGQYLPVFASLCLLNVVFSELQMFNKSFVKIHRDNKKAILFNKSLGYILVPGQEKSVFQYYILTKEDYFLKAAKWIQLAVKISGDDQKPRINGRIEVRNLDVINLALSKRNTQAQ
jgi:UDP-4-amino-4,6-dideoxy-N-acetyl-beta-L-altrosamine N-acetyltransferase